MNEKTKEVNHEDKDSSYYQYYALLSHQAQMLQDSVRTSTYQKAILSNAEQCFRGEHIDADSSVVQMTDALFADKIVIGW